MTFEKGRTMADFKQCSDKLIQTFHSRIAELLRLEDSQAQDQPKEYGIREFSDWKQCADEFESIMTERQIQYSPIQWQ